MAAKCSYPGCKADSEFAFEFEVLNKENIRVELPLCLYHLHMTMGNHFGALLDKEKPEGLEDFEIVIKKSSANQNVVELIEQIMAARELSRIAKDTTEK